MTIKNSIRQAFQKMEPIVGGYTSPLGTPKYTDRTDYEKIVDEGYKKNAVFYTATNLKADSFADLGYTVEVNGEAVEEHPLQLLLDNPNEDQGATEFRREQSIHFDLGGAVFTQIPNASESRKAVFLNNIVPRWVEVLSGGSLSPIGGFRVQVKGGYRDIPKSEMIYVRNIDPMDKWSHYAPIMSAASLIDLNNAQVGWNLSVIQNGGKSEHAFTGFTSSEEAKQFRDVNQRQTKGFMNAGKDLYLSDIKVTRLGFDSKEMDWLEGYKEVKRDIGMICGVPSDFLNDSSNKTYNNYETSIKAFIHQVIVPRGRLLCDAYNLRLAPLYGDNVKVKVDYNSIEALQGNLKERIEAGKLAYESNLTNRGEARGLAGLSAELSTDGDQRQSIPTRNVIEE